jgi:lysozyme family protein
MKEIYEKALTFTKTAEGGFANYKSDSGQMTYSGVSRKWNPLWFGWEIIDRVLVRYPELIAPYDKPPVSVKNLDKELASNEILQEKIKEFYYENYFKKCGGVSTPDILAIAMFDASVLTGVKRSVKNLQKSLKLHYGYNITVDGIFGNTSKSFVDKAIAEQGVDSLVKSYLLEYIETLKESSKIKDNKKFLLGWLERIFKLQSYLRGVR